MYLLRLLLALQAWLIAGLFVLLAVPVTVYEVAMHLENFSRPRLQIYVIRILWMVPIYAVDAWLALRFKVLHLAACKWLLRLGNTPTPGETFTGTAFSIQLHSNVFKSVHKSAGLSAMKRSLCIES